jgi:DNA invertase Pin-like site-specific DNA recombinase
MDKRLTNKVKSLAYLRTSSASNVGEDRDSHIRQLAAIERYASTAGLEIVLPPYYDAAVSGADPVDARPGFGQMLAYLSDHPDVRVILVETASRFARDLIVQETGYKLLKDRGIELISVDSPDSFVSDTPTAIMVRQILGAVSQFEKAAIVAKLKGARDRKRLVRGKCEGRKSHSEASPETVVRAKALRRQNRRTHKRMSLREIAAVLASEGRVSPRSGNAFGPSAVRSMLS